MKTRLKGRVGVTGAGGFIGSHLVVRAIAENVLVRCLRHSESQRSAPSGVEIITCDFSDANSVTAALQDVSVVFHLGGLASVAAAQESPGAAFHANTLATQNILEAARKCGTERVVLLSTAHVYGSPRYLPLTEDHPLAPSSIYAATKLAGDVLALAYNRTYGLPVNVLRPFNVYGPRQPANAVVPTIISQAVRGMAVLVRDLRPKRDFLFVDDVVDALFRAATAPAAGQEILLSSGDPVSVAGLVRRVTSITSGFPASTPEDEPDNGDCVFGKSERAQVLLGWQPKVPLAEGLERTIEWWREQLPLATAQDRA